MKPRAIHYLFIYLHHQKTKASQNEKRTDYDKTLEERNLVRSPHADGCEPERLPVKE